MKRELMQERFRDLIDEMYDDREERLIAAGRRRAYAALRPL